MASDFLQLIKKYLDNLQPLNPVETGVTAKFGKQTKEIKAVIFDIYGTLIISASGDIDKDLLSSQSLKTAFEAGGFELAKDSNETELLNSILESLHKEILSWHQDAKVKGIPFPEVEILKIWQRVLDDPCEEGKIQIHEDSSLKAMTVIFELLSNPVWPMPCLKETLETISTNGLPLGIISNAQFYTPIIMNYFLSGELKHSESIVFFDSDLMVYSFKMLKAKPDTALYEQMRHLLKNKYDFTPEEVLYIGNDMLKDIFPAQQLGFKTVLFAGDKRSLKIREEKKEMAGVMPDYIITDLRQLQQIIF